MNWKLHISILEIYKNDDRVTFRLEKHFSFIVEIIIPFSYKLGSSLTTFDINCFCFNLKEII